MSLCYTPRPLVQLGFLVEPSSNYWRETSATLCRGGMLSSLLPRATSCPSGKPA